MVDIVSDDVLFFLNLYIYIYKTFTWIFKHFFQLAQPIRLLLEHTGTEYEEKIYDCGPAPNYDKSCWFDVKFSLGLDFPNVSARFRGEGIENMNSLSSC